MATPCWSARRFRRSRRASCRGSARLWSDCIGAWSLLGLRRWALSGSARFELVVVSQGDVTAAVPASEAEPLLGAAVGDAEHAGQDRSGDAAGEVEQGGVAAVTGIGDAQAAKSGSEARSGDRRAGTLPGEEPPWLGGSASAVDFFLEAGDQRRHRLNDDERFGA